MAEQVTVSTGTFGAERAEHSDVVLGIDQPASETQGTIRSASGTLLQRRKSLEFANSETGISPVMSENLNSAAFNDPAPVSRKALSPLKRVWYTFFAPPGTKFGTWDGVYCTCLGNIIGVILFLRMGYIVGNMGVWQCLVLIGLVFVMSTVTILSTAGICATCRLKKGGLYAIIKQALGTQIGGTIGVVYCIGLSIVNAVFILGFAEAFCGVVGWNSNDLGNLRTIGMVTHILLVLVVLAGVEWVMKLQMVLLLVLAAAVLNVIIGGFVNPNFNHFISYNTGPHYNTNETFFNLLGLLFATTTGIMGGANMSGDLKHPSTSIPVGTLAAVATTNFIYVVFILIMASVALSEETPDVVSPLGYLKSNYIIAQSIAGSRVLFYIGLFIAGLTSSLGVLTGAPRVMQGIGEDVKVFGIEQFAVTFGRSEEPMRALFASAIISACFIIVGDMNSVATIMTIILCIAYASICYAYFALATGGLREDARLKIQQEEDAEEADRIRQVTQTLNRNRPQQDFRKPPRWVLAITNRWVSLIMCIWHFVLMFLINWWMGLIIFGVFVFFYVHIGFFNKNNRQGDADFSLREWLNPLHHPSRKGTGVRARQAKATATEMSEEILGNQQRAAAAAANSSAHHFQTPPMMSGLGDPNSNEHPIPDASVLHDESPYAQEMREGWTPAQDEL